jgi:molybdenum ABC transporter molybdate-binding protein
MIKYLMMAFLLLPTVPASAVELHLLASGSLREAMTEIAAQFQQATGVSVATEFGPSGLMREKVEKGDPADVFASSDMSHPKRLLAEGRAVIVAEFARSSLCVVGAPRAGLSDRNVLAKLLEPTLELGIFPPHENQLGDYSLIVFQRAEKIKPGTEQQLNAKAKFVSAGMVRGVIRPGEDFTVPLLREGTIDLLISYCSNAYMRIQPADRELTVAKLPPELNVAAHYGLALVKDAKPEAAQLAFFILSLKAQQILAHFGFSPLGVSE